MKKSKLGYGRFVLAVGAMQTALERVSSLFAFRARQLPSGIILWDVQEESVVALFPSQYASAICLERSLSTLQGRTNSPFTDMEDWFNRLDNQSLESENIPRTRLDDTRTQTHQTGKEPMTTPAIIAVAFTLLWLFAMCKAAAKPMPKP